MANEVIQLNHISHVVKQREKYMERVHDVLKECTKRLVVMRAEMGSPAFCLNDCEGEWDSQYEPYSTIKQMPGGPISDLFQEDIIPENCNNKVQYIIFEEFMTEFYFFQQHFEFIAFRCWSPSVKEPKPTFSYPVVESLKNLSLNQHHYLESLILIIGIISVVYSPIYKLIEKMSRFFESYSNIEELVAKMGTLLKEKTSKIQLLESKAAKNKEESKERELSLRRLIEESDSKCRELSERLDKNDVVIYALGEGSSPEREVEEDPIKAPKACEECEIYLKSLEELETERSLLIGQIEALKDQNASLLYENGQIGIKTDHINELFGEVDRLNGVIEEKDSTIKELGDDCGTIKRQLMILQESEAYSSERHVASMKEIEIMREMVKEMSSENIKLRSSQRLEEVSEVYRDTPQFINQIVSSEVSPLGYSRIIREHKERLVELMENSTLYETSRSYFERRISAVQNLPFLVSSCFHLIFRVKDYVDSASKRMDMLSCRLAQVRDSRMYRFVHSIVESNDMSERGSCVFLDSIGSVQSLHQPDMENSDFLNLSLFYKSVFNKLKEKLDRQIMMVLSLQRDNKELSLKMEKLKDEKNVLQVKMNRCELLNNYLKKKQEIFSPITTEDSNVLSSSLYEHLRSRIRKLSGDRLQLQLKLMDCRKQLKEVCEAKRCEIPQTNNLTCLGSSPGVATTRGGSKHLQNRLIRFKTVAHVIVAVGRMKKRLQQNDNFSKK